MSRIHYDLCACDHVLKLGQTTRIMGVINCTPDSFSGDGKLEGHLPFARGLIRDGADILDIGGESTRPGASKVSLKEELARVIPVIKLLTRKFKVPISVDTSKLEVAKSALDEGAVIVNNIRGTTLNTDFLKMVRDYQAAIVIMHMRGVPSNMQAFAKYKNVVSDVIKELKISVEKCCAIGINKDRIIVDPGIGFAKTAQQNLILIEQLDRLNSLGCPILLGTSRKSFIGKILGNDAQGRLMGTAATVTAGVMRGAHIVRVHDVKQIKETLKVTDAILNAHT